MINWSFPPELQEQYERVVAKTRQLQRELGVTPMTFDERIRAYEQRKVEEARRQEELKQLQERISRSRPPPKWKV